MLFTGNFKLRKPELGEPVDVRDLNYNADVIDSELKDRPTNSGIASKMIVEFEESKQLTELTSGDSLEGLFGKLKLTVKNVILMLSEMETLKKSVSDGKAAVAGAITEQGVNTAADASFDTMAANVTAAGNARYNAGVTATKKGNATVSQVLSGKTFTNAYGVGLTGTMTNCGAWTGTTSGNGNVTIPAGYHNGNGYVSGAGAYNAGYAAGLAEHVLVDLTVGITILYDTGSGRTVSQSLNLAQYKQLGYSTVGWSTGGGDYVVAVKENNSSGDSVYDKGYHLASGSDHIINLKDGSCPDTLYIYPDTSSQYLSTKSFTFKA